MVQTIVMTSDGKENIVQAFIQQWERYVGNDSLDICGFTRMRVPNHNFYSIGRYEDYPVNKWSDALLYVLDNIADDIFLLMLDDYWLIRQVDRIALSMMSDYMKQFGNVLKFDVTMERLFAEGGGKYLFGYNTYNHLGYLDLIKSSHASPYHLSLWGGLWNRDLLKQIIVPGESAQQIEINGTSRLSQFGDELLVLGTRQSPILHANVIQRGVWNMDLTTGLPALNEANKLELDRYIV